MTPAGTSVMKLLVESGLEVKHLEFYFASTTEVARLWKDYPEKMANLIAKAAELQLVIQTLRELDVLDHIVCNSRVFKLHVVDMSGPVLFKNKGQREAVRMHTFSFWLHNSPERAQKLGHAFAAHYKMPNLCFLASKGAMTAADLRKFLVPSIDEIFVDGSLTPLRTVLNEPSAAGCHLKRLTMDFDNAAGNQDACDLKDTDFRCVATLKELLLTKSFISTKGLLNLAIHTGRNLEGLSLTGGFWINFNSAPKSYFRTLLLSCPKLRFLSIAGCLGFTNPNVVDLGSAYKDVGTIGSLQILDFSGCPLDANSISTFFKIAQPSMRVAAFSPNQIPASYERSIISNGWAEMVEWDARQELFMEMAQLARF